MIDSETGLPYDWSNPGGGAASMQPALIPNAQPMPVGQGAGLGGGAASMQPAFGITPQGINPQLPAGFTGTAIGQQPNGGGMSPLLRYLMGAGGGMGGGLSPLLMMLLQRGGGGVPSMGMNGQVLPQIAQLLQQGGGNALTQPQGPPPDPLTPQQRAFMGYGRPDLGQQPNWAAAMGMADPTGGWSPQYQPQMPQQLTGSSGGTTNDVGIVPGTRALGQ